MKKCTKCGQILDEKYFSPRKQRSSGSYKDGLEYACKMCRPKKNWKKKYNPHIEECMLVKVKETEKHYFNQRGECFTKLKIGYRKCKGLFICGKGKQYRIEKLRNYYFEEA